MRSRSPVLTFAPWVRAIGGTRWGGPLLRQAYVGAARAAAAVFAQVPGVTAVLATGSITRPERLEPGTSDIDLLLVVSVPTVEAEVALRARLEGVHASLHRMAPVFTNLDYIEERDLDLLRAFGTIWSVDLDRRFGFLTGRDPRAPEAVPMRPGHEVELEHAVHSVKRWMRASSFLLDPAVAADKKPRVLRRLLSDLLAGALLRDRFTPLSELLRAARSLDGAGLVAELPPFEAPPLELGLAAALEETSHLVMRASASWKGEFRIATPAPPLRSPPDARALARLARLEGFAAGLVPRGPEGSGALAIAVPPDGEGAVEVVRRAARLSERAGPLIDPLFDWLPRPVVVPSSWLPAAALWGNAPLGGAAVAGSGIWLSGQAPPAPVAPPDEVVRALLRARIMKLFVRRVARTARDARAFALERAFEARSLRPALAHALETGTFWLAIRADTTPLGPTTPRADVAELQAWLEGQRRVMAGELAARKARGRQPP